MLSVVGAREIRENRCSLFGMDKKLGDVCLATVSPVFRGGKNDPPFFCLNPSEISGVETQE